MNKDGVIYLKHDVRYTVGWVGRYTVTRALRKDNEDVEKQDIDLQ